MSLISVSAGSGGTRPTAGNREIINPADGSVAAVVDEATPEDARDAVAAARAAFDDGAWPATPGGRARRDCSTGSPTCCSATRSRWPGWKPVDTGKTLAESRIDIDDVTSVFRYYAQLVGVDEADRLVDVGDPAVISRVVREPIGVCVLIAPWNYPLLQMSWKIAPALAAGCTMVAKPSEVTPLTTIAFAHLLEEAGVPPSVVNLVQGSGAILGAGAHRQPPTSTSSRSPADWPPARTIAEGGRRHMSPRSQSNSAARTRTSCSPTPTGDSTLPSTTC